MPQIKLKKLNNCRDLGHFVTKDGRKVREKMLIRSEALAKIKRGDINTLTKKYGVRVVVDLRTELECEQKPDPAIENVKYISNPVLREETLGITREKVSYRDMPKLFADVEQSPLEYMQTLYRNLVLDEKAIESFRTFFDILVYEEGAVLWHCTAGKDRAGIATALLLSALGVNRDDIIKDYLMTGYYLRKENKKLKRLIKLGVRKKNIREYLRYLLSVKREYIGAAFDAIEENYGSVENYLSGQLGLTQEKLLILKKKYLA